eukprot:bmy_20422T0
MQLGKWKRLVLSPNSQTLFGKSQLRQEILEQDYKGNSLSDLLAVAYKVSVTPRCEWLRPRQVDPSQISLKPERVTTLTLVFSTPPSQWTASLTFNLIKIKLTPPPGTLLCVLFRFQGVLSNISSITDLGGFDPVWLFLVVGGVMFILGFAGCIGALRENTFLLKFFSVFLGIIFFLELTAGVLAFVFKDWIKDQLYFFINNNIRAYRDDIDLQNLIDFTQEYWQCCGAFGADDWNLNIYFNCTDSNASRERCGVPFSCCTKDPAEDVINTQCGYDARQKPEVDQQIVIYTKGCVPQFEKWLQDNLTIVAGIFIGIALLQVRWMLQGNDALGEPSPG